jgi:hypothetical protein
MWGFARNFCALRFRVFIVPSNLPLQLGNFWRFAEVFFGGCSWMPSWLAWLFGSLLGSQFGMSINSEDGCGENNIIALRSSNKIHQKILCATQEKKTQLRTPSLTVN